MIGIDATSFLSKNKTGVEKTTCNLILAILDKDPNNTYWLYSNAPIPKLLKCENAINKVVPGVKFWTQYYLSKELKNNPPDIFWAPSHMLPNFLPKKSVATIHDLTWKIMPQIYSFSKRFFSALTVNRAIKNATKLIAVSNQTKKDLIKFFEVPGEKIEVVYHAVDDVNPEDIDSDIKIDMPYFLFVGRIESRKNVLNIIKAFGGFQKNNKETKLLLVGLPGNQYNQARSLVDELNLESSVQFLDYVSDGELVSLYKNAIGFVFPSLYEGFGVPILEAFALNTPVITSNIGAMKEVTGNAALLVNPGSSEDISNAMNKLFADNNLREDLISKGSRRLNDFSWGESADKMINLWKTL